MFCNSRRSGEKVVCIICATGVLVVLVGRGGSLSFSRKKKSTKEVQTTIDDCTHPHAPVKIVLHIYIFLEVY